MHFISKQLHAFERYFEDCETPIRRIGGRGGPELIDISHSLITLAGAAQRRSIATDTSRVAFMDFQNSYDDSSDVL